MNPSELQSIFELHDAWRKGLPNGVRADFSFKEIKDADFSGKDWSLALFVRSSFRDSSFRDSSFRDSSFRDSSFVRSSFVRSSFVRSSFDGSSFDGSSFRDSSFDGSSFRDSSFVRSSFDGSSFDGRKVFGVYSVAGGIGECGRQLLLLCAGSRSEWVWQIGCFTGNEAELRTEIDRRHADNEPNRRTCVRALDYLIATAEDERNVPEGGYPEKKSAI